MKLITTNPDGTDACPPHTLDLRKKQARDLLVRHASWAQARGYTLILLGETEDALHS